MPKLPIPFANPRTYAGHSGVDYPQPRGTLIRASGPGVMGLRNTTPRGGVTAWVDYDGYPGVAYAHLDNYAHTPARGTRVREGDIIAAVGLSGFTTGPHLHSEVYGHSTTDGYWQYFDPTRVVGQGSGSGSGSLPFPPVTPPEIPIVPEDIDMRARIVYTQRPEDGKKRWALYVAGTPYFAVWDQEDAKLANKLAKQNDTGDAIELQWSEFQVLEKAAQSA